MKKAVFAATVIASLFIAPAVMAESLVNINKADAAALDALDGIGSKKAEAIVAYRTEHGEFKTLEELKEVPGIGDGIYKKIEKDISLTDDVTASSTLEKTDQEKTAKDDAKPDDKAKGAAGETGEQGKKAEAAPKSEKTPDKQTAKADKS